MTEISRISTLSIHTTAIDNFNKVQTDLARLQDQISSGLQGRSFEDYNGQVEHLTALEAQVNRTDRFLQTNAEAELRLRTIEDALEEVMLLSDEVKTLFTARNNPTFEDNIAFEVQLGNLRLSAAKGLNTSLEGRYLFGGTRTDQPPVIEEPVVPESVTPGVPDNIYYQGSEENVHIRIDDGIEKEYDIRADDKAFQQFFAAMSLALEGHRQNDQILLDNAQNMLDDAQAGIIALTASVRSDIVDINRVVTRQNDTKLYLSGVLQEVARVDQVEAASRVAIDEATLTATFQVFARVSALRLSDFLN
ncbi:MAG: hypothetical protein F6K62_10375 [Sphaerospermopsis sp. SIO1G2]|nr:hypothetical protein [Sphaerospermopsis sp. SIO1G2]